eukprot:scpid64629/ scgid29332/ 
MHINTISAWVLLLVTEALMKTSRGHGDHVYPEKEILKSSLFHSRELRQRPAARHADDFDVCSGSRSQASDQDCNQVNQQRVSTCLILTVMLWTTRKCTEPGVRTGKYDQLMCFGLGLLATKWTLLHGIRCRNVLPRGLNTTQAQLKYLARESLAICPLRPAEWQPTDQQLAKINSSRVVCFHASDNVLGSAIRHSALAVSRIPYLVITNGKAILNSASLPCWEKDLISAQKLYKRLVKWDVDDDCIQILQTVMRKIIDHLWTTAFENDGPAHSLLAGDLALNRKLLVLAHSVVSILKRLAPTNSDYFLQRWFYPMFKRLRNRARQSKLYKRTSALAPSCKGLRGRPSEVHSTIVQLIRLLMINELHHYNYSLFSQFLVSHANLLFMMYLQLCPV